MLDWDDLRYFLAISREGTLSGAARGLGVTQPTVGRRIDAFEKKLGSRLFQRTPAGFVMTSVGEAILESCARMESEAIYAERHAMGRDEGLEGRVRVTASEWVAVRVLGVALAPLLARNAGLSIDIVADARHLNLVKGEADLALRPSAFKQQTVYQRRLGQLEFGLYGSTAYVAERRLTQFADQGAGHTLIAMADDIGDVTRAWLAANAKRVRVVARTNGREQMATLAVASVGLACLPRIVGEATPGLQRVPTAVALPRPTLWLGVHRDVRGLPRVRATIAALAKGFHQLAGQI
ncbi:MAG: LysR family transcriptional regulator [Myxococcota bacterium]|nr:LysR family transcriptional regulator [Myxococcota bacterium]